MFKGLESNLRALGANFLFPINSHFSLDLYSQTDQLYHFALNAIPPASFPLPPPPPALTKLRYSWTFATHCTFYIPQYLLYILYSILHILYSKFYFSPFIVHNYQVIHCKSLKSFNCLFFSTVMPSSKSTLCSGDAKAFIRDYMKSQYRPYSTSDIQLNLHNQVTRSKLGPILDDLVDEKELIVKTIGKTNYYCFKELHIEQNVGIDAGGEEEAFKEQLKVLEARIEILLTGLYFCFQIIYKKFQH